MLWDTTAALEEQSVILTYSRLVESLEEINTHLGLQTKLHEQRLQPQMRTTFITSLKRRVVATIWRKIRRSNAVGAEIMVTWLVTV